MAKKDEDDENSDVELEGMDVDSDSDSYTPQTSLDASPEDEDSTDEVAGEGSKEEPQDEEEEDGATTLANAKLREADELKFEQAKVERERLLAAIKKEEASNGGGSSSSSSDSSENREGGESDAEHRMKYLMSQSEMFAHFLEGTATQPKAAFGRKTKDAAASSSSSSSSSSASSGPSGRGGSTNSRMTEAAEDAALLSQNQSTPRTALIKLTQQPSILSPICKMHPYQLEGLNWMIKLHDNGINGILADEMGLGKTLQTISLLAYLREARGVTGQHLVIVPKSVVGNWIKEFKKWCPKIRTQKMLGSKEERQLQCRQLLSQTSAKTSAGGKGKLCYAWDVCVCSYESLLKEKSTMGKIKWDYSIIDEAHRIKNENSSLSQVVRTIPSKYRLLITGTPLQNNLHELWALLNFLLPDVFGNADKFDTWFSMEGKEGQDNVIKKLHTILRPFMLRRVKRDVALSLPPKKETKLFIGLTDMQVAYYTKILKKEALELNSIGGAPQVKLLNVLMQLRKVCNHPYLFEGAEPGPPYHDGPHLWENSGKMQLLHKLLIKLKQKESRVLIFSQMTRTLDILEDYLGHVEYDYCRIDGSTDGEERDSQMDVFNAPESPKFCFLLSTRAGGLGINLATADIVILFDSDWNPQVDLQAMDRAHRIGQTKPVQVFRFVSEGTVEEKIIERADRKLFLDAAVIQQGRLAEQHSNLGKDDLMKMVRFGAEQILNKKDGGTYTDHDIDTLLATGEERTAEMNSRLQTNVQHNLATFSLMGDEEESSLFNWGGEDYRGKNGGMGMMIDIGQRERNRGKEQENNDNGSNGNGAVVVAGGGVVKRRGIVMLDHQFYNKSAIDALNMKEADLADGRARQITQIKELKARARIAPSIGNSRVEMADGESAEELTSQYQTLEKEMEYKFKLTADERTYKNKLQEEAFTSWSKSDFRSFIAALERHGRWTIDKIQEDVHNSTGKMFGDIQKYYVKFMYHYQELDDWEKFILRFDKAEKKASDVVVMEEVVQNKVNQQILVNGNTRWRPELLTSTAKSRNFTGEEDSFLLFSLAKHGYGKWEKISLDIKSEWQFRLDWYFRMRSFGEIKTRCDLLVRNLVLAADKEAGGGGEGENGGEGEKKGKVEKVKVEKEKVEKVKVEVDEKSASGGKGKKRPLADVEVEA